MRNILAAITALFVGYSQHAPADVALDAELVPPECSDWEPLSIKSVKAENYMGQRLPGYLLIKLNRKPEDTWIESTNAAIDNSLLGRQLRGSIYRDGDIELRSVPTDLDGAKAVLGILQQIIDETNAKGPFYPTPIFSEGDVDELNSFVKSEVSGESQ